MKRIGSIVLAIALSLSMLAGCGGGGGGGSQSSSQALKVGVKSVNQSLDPHYSYGTDCFGTMQVYDTLVTMNETDGFNPCLAERWDISEDGTEYTFYIKKGVKFHNGDELKASDVVFSLERGKASPYVSSVYTMVDTIEEVDEYTVKVVLTEPFVPFLAGISIVYGSIVSQKVVEQYGEEYGKTAESVVGTGPYCVNEWTPGQSLSFKAFEDYHGGAAAVKDVDVKLMSDETTAVVALQTGEIDLFDNVPNINLDSLKQDKNLTVEEFPGMSYVYAVINQEREPFTDDNFKKALACGIDRERFVLFGAEGHGEPCVCPATEGFAGYPAGVEWYEYDLEKAQQYLADSTYDPSRVIEIKAASNTVNQKLATTLQEELTRIGIQSKVLLVERSAMLDDVYGKAEYDISIQNYGIVSKDMDFLFCHLHSSMMGLSGNAALYNNPEMDEYLEKGRSELDPEKRKEHYRGAVELFIEDVVHIPFYYPNINRVYNNRIRMKSTNPNYDMVFLNQVEWNS